MEYIYVTTPQDEYIHYVLWPRTLKKANLELKSISYMKKRTHIMGEK